MASASGAIAGPRGARGWPGVWSNATVLPPQPVVQPIQSRPYQAAQLPAVQNDPFINELRFGVLMHDAGIFGRNEEDGIDVNGEFLVRAPQWQFWKMIFSPRPHLGLTVNTEGDTSQFYAGLTWRIEGRSAFFLDLSLGGAVHDGALKTDDMGQKELGSRILFREAIEVGYRFTRHHTVSVMLDHISNANLADRNEGLDSLGVRYSYRY